MLIFCLEIPIEKSAYPFFAQVWPMIAEVSFFIHKTVPSIKSETGGGDMASTFRELGAAWTQWLSCNIFLNIHNMSFYQVFFVLIGVSSWQWEMKMKLWTHTRFVTIESKWIQLTFPWFSSWPQPRLEPEPFEVVQAIESDCHDDHNKQE